MSILLFGRACRELSQKILRGLNESRKKGFYCGGGIPYGYKVVARKIVEDCDKADIVRYIFSQYALGVYVPTIIKALTERGVYHNGKPFAPNTVYHILKNEKYLGIYRNKGEEYDNIYPQIVPIEIFDKVRAKVQKNKYGKRSVQVTYLLRHKLKCGTVVRKRRYAKSFWKTLYLKLSCANSPRPIQ